MPRRSPKFPPQAVPPGKASSHHLADEPDRLDGGFGLPRFVGPSTSHSSSHVRTVAMAQSRSITGQPGPLDPFARFSAVPEAQGLYNPAFEKDACGLAMVATLRGTAGHDIIETALNALRNLEHRGAVGSDAGTGDGAGIITQVPDAFLRAVSGLELPG